MGAAAESLARQWISVELSREYAVLSALRFMEGWVLDRIRTTLPAIDTAGCTQLETYAGLVDIGEVVPAEDALILGSPQLALLEQRAEYLARPASVE